MNKQYNLSSPPLTQKVMTTLTDLGISDLEQLLDQGVISTFLQLKASGLTITQSTLWQLWAIANNCSLQDLNQETKQNLLSALKQHPPVHLAPPKATQNHYMAEAILEAKKAYQIDEVPIGCIIVYQDKIIGRGYNLSRTKKQVWAHAEIMAITEASSFLSNFRLNECDLYTTVEPCPMCASAIIQARVKRVIIGTMEPKTGAAGSVINLFHNRKINTYTSIYSGTLHLECQALLTQFFAEKRTKA